MGPFEFVNAQWGASDDKPVLLHKNCVGLEPRALRGVDLVGGTPVAFFVEMQQRVVERYPNFSIFPVDSHRRKDSLERGLLAFAFLALDLLARGLCRRHGLERGVLNVLSRVAQAIVLPNRRLRQESKSIVEMPLGVCGELPNVEKTI